MAMRLFFVLVTVAGSAYLLFTNRGDRKVTIAAVAASSFGLLLQRTKTDNPIGGELAMNKLYGQFGINAQYGRFLLLTHFDFGYAFLAAIPALYILIFHVSYRRDRILAFLNPYADPQGRGFHIIQSLIAVSTGGVTGLGLMEGKQKCLIARL